MKIRRAGERVKQKHGIIFLSSKCPGCDEAPADDYNCNASGWHKLPNTYRTPTSGGAPDATGAYASQYAKKTDKRTGKCAPSPFWGEPMYFWDNDSILGSAPHCGWRLLVVNNGEWINE
jgi:hypothetical protein